MVEDFSDLASVKFEVGVREVDQEDDSPEDEEHGIVELAHGVKWIISDFITERLIVGVGLLLPCGGMRVTTRENMLMAE